MARGLAPDGRTKPGARVGWGAVAAGARALKEKAERSGASPCEFDYQVGRRGCLLLAIGPVREAQNPAASSRVLRASAVRSSTLYAIEDLRFTDEREVVFTPPSLFLRRSARAPGLRAGTMVGWRVNMLKERLHRALFHLEIYWRRLARQWYRRHRADFDKLLDWARLHLLLVFTMSVVKKVRSNRCRLP